MVSEGPAAATHQLLLVLLGGSTGPPVINRSPCGQEGEDDKEREISFGPSVEVVELFWSSGVVGRKPGCTGF